MVAITVLFILIEPTLILAGCQLGLAGSEGILAVAAQVV